MKKWLLMSFVVAASFNSFELCAHKKWNVTTRADQRQRVITAYVSSLLLSGCVGVTTGSIARFLEKKLDVRDEVLSLCMTLLIWTLESEFRTDIILALQKDLDDYRVEYRRGLMFKSAWIASWLSYLNA